MSQKIAPPAADNIQIFLAVRIVQVQAPGVVNHHRREYLRIFHLLGRMPDIFGVFRLPVCLCHLFNLLIQIRQNLGVDI